MNVEKLRIYFTIITVEKVRCASQTKLINQILEEWIGLLKVHQNHWTMDTQVLESMNVTPHSLKQNLKSGDLISNVAQPFCRWTAQLNFEQADLMNWYKFKIMANFRLLNGDFIKSSALNNQNLIIRCLFQLSFERTRANLLSKFPLWFWLDPTTIKSHASRCAKDTFSGFMIVFWFVDFPPIRMHLPG